MITPPLTIGFNSLREITHIETKYSLIMEQALVIKVEQPMANERERNIIQ